MPRRVYCSILPAKQCRRNPPELRRNGGRTTSPPYAITPPYIASGSAASPKRIAKTKKQDKVAIDAPGNPIMLPATNMSTGNKRAGNRSTGNKLTAPAARPNTAQSKRKRIRFFSNRRGILSYLIMSVIIPQEHSVFISGVGKLLREFPSAANWLQCCIGQIRTLNSELELSFECAHAVRIYADDERILINIQADFLAVSHFGKEVDLKALGRARWIHGVA